MSIVIEKFDFDKNTPTKIHKSKRKEIISEWPVVYIINNDKEAYVGETVNAAVRMSQHIKNDERKSLKNVNIISDTDFNKSVILDLEAYLIKYMSSDGTFRLQNSNRGIMLHNYYNREEYEKKFKGIWNELRERNLAQQSIQAIENSDLFKYSPYKALNIEQYRVVDELLRVLTEECDSEHGCTMVVSGSAGTGKTVLATYLMKFLTEAGKSIPRYDELTDPGLEDLSEMCMKLGEMKIGIVIPQQSLRSTIKNVFKNVKGLTTKMVLSPTDVPKDTYDLLIVDEAHRLKQRKALSQYPVFDNNNIKFGLGNEGTELDWILRSSKNQILFYDSAQSVKPSDIDKNVFDKLIDSNRIKKFTLKSQWRCQGGEGYVDYVKSIMSDTPPQEKECFDNYEFKLFDNVNEMIEAIKAKDKECGLCRTVAGYSWKWETKQNNRSAKNKVPQDYDIKIGPYKYIWNTVNKDWVNSPNAINEIGCIHTVQGYDLNYGGVILGNEIKYDNEKKQIYIDKSNYHDLQGKTALRDEEELKEYILNIYVTLMTRGIKGTYVYACDENMNEYMKHFF